MMNEMTLENITAACSGKYVGNPQLKTEAITGVEKDSRLVEKGFLYLPFVGEHVDGHDFIPEAFKRGALCVLSEKELSTSQQPYILVNSVAKALKQIAAFYREHIDCHIVGITGSVGKTSTKEMVASVLGEKYNVLKTEGNYNNEIGMPLTILKIRDTHQVAVVEMGISNFGEMSTLSSIAHPDICIITNIGQCHLETLKDRDGVLKAKSEMFDYASDDCFTVLNGDDDKLLSIKEVKNKKPLFFGKNSDLDVNILSYDTQGLTGTKVKIKYPEGIIDTYIPIPGEHMLYSAMAAVCVGYHLGMTKEEIDKGIRNAKSISGRDNIFDVGSITVIDDCYNANPMSMEAALKVLSDAKGRKVAILGDMFELGENSKNMHLRIGELAVKYKVDCLICVGEMSKNIMDSANGKIPSLIHFDNTDKLKAVLEKYIECGDTVLVKASNGMHFNTLIEKIKSLDI